MVTRSAEYGCNKPECWPGNMASLFTANSSLSLLYFFCSIIIALQALKFVVNKNCYYKLPKNSASVIRVNKGY